MSAVAFVDDIAIFIKEKIFKKIDYEKICKHWAACNRSEFAIDKYHFSSLELETCRPS